MAVTELTGPFVSQGPFAIRGGRMFGAWKKPGERRNTLFEIKFGVPPIALGYTPGPYFIDGECALAFNDATNELLMLNYCSPDPTTGGQARPLVWTTGLFVPGVGGGGGTDPATLARITALEAAVKALDARLDKIAAGAAG